MTVRAKKHLGQHFLTDRKIAARIIGMLHATPETEVVEIGPGRGILTVPLLDAYKNLKIIEIDDEAVTYIRTAFADKNPQVIHTDFLKWPIARDIGPDASFIGNLPYNISSPIFFTFLENRQYVREAVCMIQKEVAVRIAAGPGGKEYGILSVLLGHYYEIEYGFSVSPGVFSPPPKVMSAVIALRRRDNVEEIDFNLFKKVVKAAFNQRRKTLRNALKGLEFEPFPELEHWYTLRAEQLPVSAFVTLTKALKNSL